MATDRPASLSRGEHSDAIRAIHFPGSWEERDAAREHLVLSEFFAMQMLIASRRFESSAQAGQAHCGPGALADKFLKALPFELTAAQRKVISEIRRDLAAIYPMNRLLQGDVGSGKTVVAIAAMLLAVEADTKARSWPRRKFWLSSITKYCGGGSSRSASVSHYEHQRDTKKPGHCHFSHKTRRKLWGAQAASLSCPAACRTHLQAQRIKAQIHQAIAVEIFHISSDHGQSTQLRLRREIIGTCQPKRGTSFFNRSSIGTINATNFMRRV
jgi:hypothetical protein